MRPWPERAQSNQSSHLMHATYAVCNQCARMSQNKTAVHQSCRQELDLQDAIACAEETFGALYLLVNNAGVMGALSKLEDTTALDFERTLRINLISVFLGTKHAIRLSWKHQCTLPQQCSYCSAHQPLSLVYILTDDIGPAMCRAMLSSSTLGAIVNVTSAAALRGGLSPADYSTSKAGVLALTQQAACEAAPHGIRVNSVAPAYVPTVRCMQESSAIA